MGRKSKSTAKFRRGRYTFESVLEGGKSSRVGRSGQFFFRKSAISGARRVDTKIEVDGEISARTLYFRKSAN